MEIQRRTWPSDLLAGLLIYCISAVPVAIGFAAAEPPNLSDAFFHFDGWHYLNIAQHGYWFDSERPSEVAFFPGYPVTARAVALTGLSTRLALILVSNLGLVAALAFFSTNLRTQTDAVRWSALVILGLWPVGVCFRVGYSESLLLAVLSLFLLGISRRWPLVVLALIAGAATGIRAVGLAASVAVIAHVLFDAERGSWKKRFAAAAAIAPLSCWGLLAYMLFQFVQFDAPFAFLQTQRHWSVYSPEHREPIDKLLRLAIAEPIWDCYVPGSQRHWSRFNGDENPLFGSAFWNPLVFALTGFLVVFGWFRKWLSREEAILGLGLLFIPYVSRADEQSMISHARFAAVTLPAFLVMGRILSRLPRIVRGIVYAFLATMLGLWTALFAAGRPLL